LPTSPPGPDKPHQFPGGIHSHDYYQLADHPHALDSLRIQAGREKPDDASKPVVVGQILDQPGVHLYLEGGEKADDPGKLLALAGQARVLRTSRAPDNTCGAHSHTVHRLAELSAARMLQHPVGREPTARQLPRFRPLNLPAVSPWKSR
jgi:hypothetical protein